MSADIKAALAVYVEEKYALEQRIQILVAAELEAFTERTGVDVASIGICMVTVQPKSGVQRAFVDNVRVSTALG